MFKTSHRCISICYQYGLYSCWFQYYKHIGFSGYIYVFLYLKHLVSCLALSGKKSGNIFIVMPHAWWIPGLQKCTGINKKGITFCGLFLFLVWCTHVPAWEIRSETLGDMYFCQYQMVITIFFVMYIKSTLFCDSFRMDDASFKPLALSCWICFLIFIYSYSQVSILMKSSCLKTIFQEVRLCTWNFH